MRTEDLAFENDTIVSELARHLKSYLEDHPHLSLNAISKRCSVSEPTLRRIAKGEVKTTPDPKTVVEILSYLSKKKSISELCEAYSPGPLADFLKSKFGALCTSQSPYQNSAEINRIAKNPTKYIIYKLCANHSGMRRSTAQELFGTSGEQALRELVAEELVAVSETGICNAKIKGFTVSQDLFVQNFKTVADFLKPEHLDLSSKTTPVMANLSNSINSEAYQQIVKIQRQALQKILEVLNKEESLGEIPVFVLSAVDTLDIRPAKDY